jgi:cytosine/adenosine deaminase-related metal-dependent hydrolase
MSDFWLTRAWLFRPDADGFDPLYADVRVAKGRIVEILAGGSALPVGGTDVVNAQGRVVTAPLVNFHEHCYSRLAKGLPGMGPFGNFVEILENLWWRLDRALDGDMIRASAELTAMESIAQGVTYIFDHHSSPSHINGSLKIVADVFREYGLRGVLCYETSDRDGPEKSREALAENVSFAGKHANADIKGMLGLHAPFTLSDGTLSAAADAANRSSLGIHMHLAEDAHENAFSEVRYGKSAARRLTAAGLLKERSIVAHGVHLTDEDRKLLAQTGCALACCPDSNMNNRVGLADYRRIAAATPVLPGTDGMHANIARTLKQLFLLYRHQGATMPEAFHWLTKICADQNSFVRRYFPDFPALSLEERADFMVWDYVPPTPLAKENALGHFIYGVLESPVRTVVGAGRFLMRDFRLCIGDETARRTYVAQQGARLRERLMPTAGP